MFYSQQMGITIFFHLNQSIFLNRFLESWLSLSGLLAKLIFLKTPHYLSNINVSVVAYKILQELKLPFFC